MKKLAVIVLAALCVTAHAKQPKEESISARAASAMNAEMARRAQLSPEERAALEAKDAAEAEASLARREQWATAYAMVLRMAERNRATYREAMAPGIGERAARQVDNDAATKGKP